MTSRRIFISTAPVGADSVDSEHITPNDLPSDCPIISGEITEIENVLTPVLRDSSLSNCSFVWTGCRPSSMYMLTGSATSPGTGFRGPVAAALQYITRTFLSSSPHQQMKLGFLCSMSNGKGKVTDLFKTIDQKQVGDVTHPIGAGMFDNPIELGDVKYLYFSNEADVMKMFTRLTQSNSFQKIQSKLSYGIIVQCLRGPRALPTQIMFVEVHPELHSDVASGLLKNVESPTNFITAALRMPQQVIIVKHPPFKLLRPPPDMLWSDVVQMCRTLSKDGLGSTFHPLPPVSLPTPTVTVPSHLPIAHSETPQIPGTPVPKSTVPPTPTNHGPPSVHPSHTNIYIEVPTGYIPSGGGPAMSSLNLPPSAGLGAVQRTASGISVQSLPELKASGNSLPPFQLATETDNALLVEQGVSRRLRERTQQLEDQVRVLTSQRDSAEVELARYKKDYAGLRQRVAQQDDESVRGSRSLTKLQQELNNVMDERKELETQNQDLEDQLDRVMQELRRERTVFNQRAALTQDLEKKTRLLEKQLQDAEGRIVEMTGIVRKLENDRDERIREFRVKEEELMKLQEQALQQKLKFDCEMTRVKELHNAELHNQRKDVEDAHRTIERSIMTQKAVWEQESARQRRDADIKIRALEDERREILQAKEHVVIELTEAKAELISAQEKMQLLNTLLADAGTREKDEKMRTDRLRNELDHAQQTILQLKQDIINQAQKVHEATIAKEQVAHSHRQIQSKEFQYERDKETLTLEIRQLEVRNRYIFYERETDRLGYDERWQRRAIEFDEQRDFSAFQLMELELRFKSRLRVFGDDTRNRDYSIRTKLTAAEQQMEDYRDRCLAAEGQLRSLQDSLEERSRAHRAEVLDLQNIITKTMQERDRRMISSKEMEELQKGLEDDLNRCRQELGDTRKMLHVLTQDKVTLQSALCGEREAKLIELAELRQKLEDLITSQADREHEVSVKKDDEIREMAKKIDLEIHRRNEFQQQVEYLEQTRNNLQEDLVKMQKREKEVRKEMANLQGAISKLSKELGERDTTITQLQQRIGKLHALRDDLQAREHHILQDRDIRERQLESEFTAQRKLYERRMEELEADRTKLTTQLQELNSKWERLGSEKLEKESDAREVRGELRHALELIEKLEASLSKERAQYRTLEQTTNERIAHCENQNIMLRSQLNQSQGDIERLRIMNAAVTHASPAVQHNRATAAQPPSRFMEEADFIAPEEQNYRPPPQPQVQEDRQRVIDERLQAIQYQEVALRQHREIEMQKLAEASRVAKEDSINTAVHDPRLKSVYQEVESVRRKLDTSAAQSASKKTDASIGEARRRLMEARGALQSILHDS